MPKRVSSALLLFLAAYVIPAPAAPIFTLIPPGGALAGTPGQAVGWGFNLINSSSFPEVTNVVFSPASGLGTFLDYLTTYQFVVVGPAPELSSITQAIDPVAHRGLGQFAISSSAPPGSNASGNVVLSYSLFTVSPNDPNFDPFFDTISVGNTLSAPAASPFQRAPSRSRPRGLPA